MNKLQCEHEQDKLAHVNKWLLLTADDGFSNRNRYEGGRGFMPHEELVDQHRNKDQQTDRQTSIKSRCNFDFYWCGWPCSSKAVAIE